MKVLIVDDDRIAREILERQLTTLEYEVVAVDSGDEAWERLQAESFSFVITDWIMPGMDGIELLKRIRGAESEQYVYCILLTVKWQIEEIVAGMDAGADDFLTKPFDPHELRVRMEAGRRIIELERQLSESNRRMKNELQSAATIQHALLPTTLPEIDGCRFAWKYQPCDELGGDILNIIPLSADQIAIYLLDVSGHGVSAALLSVALSRLLTTATNSASLIRDINAANDYQVVEPAEVLARLNDRFVADLDGGRFFTMLYGVLDLTRQELRYASGAHPPAILLGDDGEIRTLDPTGTLVGIFPDEVYEQTTVSLRPGDRLLIYSDGLTEAMNGSEESIGIDSIMQCVQDNARSPIASLVDDVFERLETWVQPLDLDDDVSCLIAEIQ